MRSIACASAMRSWAAEGGKLIAGLPVQAEAPVAFSACAQARIVSSGTAAPGWREKNASVFRPKAKLAQNWGIRCFRSLFLIWAVF